ncbi:Thioredoxin [Polaribacter huanghezhanensis]|uniref:TlpA disulfide reductase family protein n=1 Tax=Polaribacter huanghezhanensis TaxID=1354726 RepID=UPI0026478AC9|nr:TlpA disulfide reductase family protein [Polaribacter huanghezhanensis]WKD85866.1 Thioredoxin [Polaribacter huanghezhanensis]
MKQFIFISVLMILISSCETKKSKTLSFARKPLETVKQEGIAIEVYNFENFKPFLNQKNDTTYVVNFWATWCVPCVKELPNFEKINEEYSNKKVKIILVSLDFANKIKTQLIPFIQKKGIKSKVILLNEPDANSWISKIDKDWTGAVPATLIYNKNHRKFYSKPFTYNELKTEINNH